MQVLPATGAPHRLHRVRGFRIPENVPAAAVSRSSFWTVPAVDGPGGLLFGGVIVVGIILVAGFLKMVLQLLFCVAAALTHGTHLLRRWCGMGVLVRTMIPILAHSGIVPLDVGLGKRWPLPQGLEVGPEP